VKRILQLLGTGTLILWTGLGLVAWSNVARQLAADQGHAESYRENAARLLALGDELATLHQDVRALAGALGENLQALDEGLRAQQDEHAAELEHRLAALREQVDARPSFPTDALTDLLRELGALRDALAASAVPGSAAFPVVVAATGEPDDLGEMELLERGEPSYGEPANSPENAVERAEPAAPVAPAAEAAKPRKSFLAFKLPSDDLRFDERRTWAILPALSRVGFDAKTTLHDFTAATTAVEGELEADLARAGEAPRARIRVQAASLASGDAGRDESMREHLSVERHPTLDFELTSFEAGTVDLEQRRATGRAHGRMTLRGVTQEVTMPVTLSIDEARRLCVEGQMSLDLTRFAVPVPSKLGVISMEKEVQVWISLRLRVQPRTEG